MNLRLLAVVVCGVLGLVGCSGGSASNPADASAASQEGTQAAAAPAPLKPAVHVPADAPPDRVVATFLDALKNGDTATKASLLTAKALTETTKHEFEVNPQSAPHAQFQVHPPEFLPNNPNGAHVTSVWTETYEDGQITYDVVWVLRREEEGWRIAGMAIELIPNQPPAFLNFEDPADMEAKYKEAIAAAQQAEQGPAVETATRPESPTTIQANPIER